MRAACSGGRAGIKRVLACCAAAALLAAPGFTQAPDVAGRFLREKLGLSEAQIQQIQQGTPLVRRVDTPDRAEILIYGAVYVNGDPEKFVGAYTEVEKLVDGKTYLAAGRFRSPPTIQELNGLQLDEEDLKQLRECEPGDCEVQLGAEQMRAFRTRVNWGSGDAARQANGLARELALGGLKAYISGGNRALGVYQDQRRPVDVENVFRTVLGRAKDLPRYVPEFHRYLLEYPRNKPNDTWDFFYWEDVDFGLKPTFRINHAIVHQPPGARGDWVVASKQIYATHYFQSALDLWMCVEEAAGGKQGFYLLTIKGSRQEGLTGFKGRLLRPIVLSKTEGAMVKGLERLKRKLETEK